MNQSYEGVTLGEFPTLFPDESFEVSYEIDGGEQHLVVVQWMGEGKGVAPGYYVFEGKEYTDQTEYQTISPEELSSLTDEQLQGIFPDEKELDPSEAVRVIEHIAGFGWTERGKGKTEHSEAIGKVIEKVFS